MQKPVSVYVLSRGRNGDFMLYCVGVILRKTMDRPLFEGDRGFLVSKFFFSFFTYRKATFIDMNLTRTPVKSAFSIVGILRFVSSQRTCTFIIKILISWYLT